jgi:hypothetical protein
MSNLIRIKRSTTTAIPASLANGELAWSSNGNVLYIGANGAIEAIAGSRNPGVLTANQALVANATGYLDQIKVANLTLTALQANGSYGTAGQVLVSNGSGTYWGTGTSGSNTQIQFNDSGVANGSAGFTFDKTSNNLTVGNTVIAQSANLSANISSSNTTSGTLTVVGGVGVTGRINTGDLAAGNTTVYSSLTGTTLTTTNVVATNISGNGSAITSVDAATVGGNTALDLRNYADTAANTAYTNAVSFSNSAASNAYSNAMSDTLSRSGSYTGNNTFGGTNTIFTSNVTISGTINRSPTITLAGDLSGSVTLTDLANGTLTATIAADSVALGTDTTGNYVATITAGAGISGSSATEGGTPTIAVVANNGLSSNSSGVFVVAGTGVTSNATGVHIGQAVGTTDNVTFNDLTVNGNTIVGSNSSDVVAINALVNTNITPSANITYSLGTNALRWNEIHASNVHSVDGYFEGSVEVNGNLIVSGNLTTTNVNSVIVSDPLIYLAGNNYSSDLVDIGFAGNYHQGGVDKHTGLFRDASIDQYYLFKGLTQELANAVTVNTADPTFTIADLNAYLISGGLVTNATHVAITANSTVNVAITANTLALATALAATDGGTGFDTYNTGDILVANTGNALSKLALGTAGYVLQSNGTALVYDILDGGTF